MIYDGSACEGKNMYTHKSGFLVLLLGCLSERTTACECVCVCVLSSTMFSTLTHRTHYSQSEMILHGNAAEMDLQPILRTLCACESPSTFVIHKMSAHSLSMRDIC